MSVWVSRLDGSDWLELGQQETPAPDGGFGEHLMKFQAGSPGALTWLPDGKTLSFFYRGDLYTLPVKRSAKAPQTSVKAVYLASDSGGELRADDLSQHPEVKVVYSFAEFQHLADKRTAPLDRCKRASPDRGRQGACVDHSKGTRRIRLCPGRFLRAALLLSRAIGLFWH